MQTLTHCGPPRLWPHHCESAGVIGDAEIEPMTHVEDVRPGFEFTAIACKRGLRPTPHTCGLPCGRGVWWLWLRKHH
jgi:hypothetical protein